MCCFIEHTFCHSQLDLSPKLLWYCLSKSMAYLEIIICQSTLRTSGHLAQTLNLGRWGKCWTTVLCYCPSQSTYLEIVNCKYPLKHIWPFIFLSFHSSPQPLEGEASVQPLCNCHWPSQCMYLEVVICKYPLRHTWKFKFCHFFPLVPAAAAGSKRSTVVWWGKCTTTVQLPLSKSMYILRNG